MKGPVREGPARQRSVMQRWLISLIEGYQSRGGGRRFFNTECNFEPSCSEYTRQAIHKYGALRGMRLGARRIRACTDPDCVEKIHHPLT